LGPWVTCEDHRPSPGVPVVWGDAVRKSVREVVGREESGDTLGLFWPPKVRECCSIAEGKSGREIRAYP
jgi:hypothetical protein